MTSVVIYSKPFCPYCVKAERLLKDADIEYTKIDIGADPSQRDMMLARSNGKTTVPQIFVGDHHIGGFDDLNAAYQDASLFDLIGRPVVRFAN